MCNDIYARFNKVWLRNSKVNNGYSQINREHGDCIILIRSRLMH
jgi:hypothetical protein